MLLRTPLVQVGFVVAAIAAPCIALAAHGKVGLWEISTRVDMPNMMAQIPPEQMARMKAMGVQMPNGQTITSRHCMTAAEVAVDGPPPLRHADDCKMGNMSHDAHTLTADMLCSGEMQGQGHLTVTYDSNEHYSGSYAFNGTAHGHPQNVNTSFEGRWISADCGSMK